MTTEHPFSIDLEDWYQGIELEHKDWTGKERRLEKGMDVILQMLDDTDTKCTFFTIGWIGEKYPKMIRSIAEQGHEIASHGYIHDKTYHLTREEFKERIKKTKDVLEDVSGQKVVGHRAPFFSITKDCLWALEVLKELDFEYDCSISPVQTWRYGIAGSPEEIYVIDELGLVEYPSSNFKLFGKKFNVGGAYFRVFPYFLTKNRYKENTSKNIPTMFYAHPWEYDPGHPVVSTMEWKAKLTHYFNLSAMEGRTRDLLKSFNFTTVKNILDRQNVSSLKRVSISHLQNLS